MEAIGIGIAAIGETIGSIALWAGLIGISAIGALTFLIYTDKINLNDVKEFFGGKDKRW